MPLKSVLLRCVSCVAATPATLALAGVPSTGLDAHWQHPLSGEWTGPNASPAFWSTDPLRPIGPDDRATLGATGSPYTVEVHYGLAVERIDIDSPDATLELLGGTLIASDGVHANGGPLVLQRGTVQDTRLAGASAVQTRAHEDGATRAFLDNVTLATTLTGQLSSARDDYLIGVANDLTLDGGEVVLKNNLALAFISGAGILGEGVVRAAPNDAAWYRTYRELVFGDNATPHTIGAGVTILASDETTLRISDNTPPSPYGRVINEGEIRADGGHVSIRDLSLTNLGTLRALNGGTLSIHDPKPGTTLGQVELASGGVLGFYDNLVTIDQPITIPATTSLRMGALWKSLSTITVDGGTLVAIEDQAPSGQFVWRAGSTLKVEHLTTLDELSGYGTSAGVTLDVRYLDLGDAAESLGSVPGEWRFNNTTVQNGTLLEIPPNALSRDEDYLKLYDVVVELPVSVDAGVLDVRGESSFASGATVTGGELQLRDDWSSPGGIVVDGGRLELHTQPQPADLITIDSGTLDLRTRPHDAGAITFNDGNLDLGISATLSELQGYGWSINEVLVRSTLDLEGQLVNVSRAPFYLRLAGGIIRNGVVARPGQRGDWNIEGGALHDVTIEVDVTTSAPVELRGNVEVVDSTLNGEFTARVGLGAEFTLRNAEVRGVLTLSQTPFQEEAFTTIHDQLTVDGELRLGNARVQIADSGQLLGPGEINMLGPVGGRAGPAGGISAESVLRIGSELTFRTRAAGSYLESEFWSVINDGAILVERSPSILGAQTPGPDFSIRANYTFENTGTLRIDEGLEVDIDAREFLNRGVVENRGGVLVIDREAVNLGEIRGDGVILALGSGALINGGQIAIGDRTPYEEEGSEGAATDDRVGMLQLVGDYTGDYPDAVLRFDLAGDQPGQGYDRFVVSGEATLFGELEVALLDGFAPEGGQSFELITAAGGIEGTFGGLELPPEYNWGIDYGFSTVVLTAFLRGDFNSDGSVDLDDLAVYHAEYGSQRLDLTADANRDGRVDAADYTFWRDAYRSQQVAIPEPAGVVVVVALALAIPTRRG